MKSEPEPTTETRTVWVNHSHKYWREKNPVVDQVLITDVQVDLDSVVIRECPTDKGFFRERNNANWSKEMRVSGARMEVIDNS